MVTEITYPNEQPNSSRARKNDEREASSNIDVPDSLLSDVLFPDLGWLTKTRFVLTVFFKPYIFWKNTDFNIYSKNSSYFLEYFQNRSIYNIKIITNGSKTCKNNHHWIHHGKVT